MRDAVSFTHADVFLDFCRLLPGFTVVSIADCDYSSKVCPAFSGPRERCLAIY